MSRGGGFLWRTELSIATLFCGCFLLCSSVINGGAEFRFPDPKQVEFLRGLESYEITVPIRVKRNGEFLKHSLYPDQLTTDGHSVNKRSVHFDINSNVEEDDFNDDGILHYNIRLKNHVWHLELQPNHGFISPGLIIERRKNRFGNLSDVSISRPQHNIGSCHFIGTIRGHSASKVSLGTCNGLTGYLKTGHDDYFIEPVKGHNSTESPEHPHVIYKRSAIPIESGGISDQKREDKHHIDGSCGVEDSVKLDPIRQRERWERYAGTDRHVAQAKHRRKKRSILTEKHVETLIVVDPKMVRYYQNEDIETYILTIMNMVETIFHDASIGNAINIVLVRILLLEEDQDDLKISHHADNTLRSFCQWQKKINPKQDDHPNHHDVAILLTRYNICSRMNQPCSTLGLAQVAGMCQSHRSCNINEDTGLALAFTIAHELGHNFGMKHDGIHNKCQSPPGGRQHVMTPHLTADSIPLLWSNCSRKAITKFLDRDWGYCLDDEPSGHVFKFPVLPSGTMYDAVHQCQLQYGTDAGLCDGIENICDTMWCRVDNKCLTKLEAAAEGTLCGDNKWCYNGHCEVIGERPEAINGEWGEWGRWGGCTRTCGAGIALRMRHCENPPPSNGGKYCLGERKRYRVCNTESCSEDAPNFRHYQCSEFDKRPYKKQFFTWKPVPALTTPCQLHCRPKDKYFSVKLKDIITDGTPCMPGTRDMCISGRCRHVGCDWLIDSNAREDRCGICHGDGSTCKTIKQHFIEKQGVGYVEATVIPSGARNIRVEEVAEANNYLALRSNHGDYYLNGNWFIQWSGDYEVAGTTVRYTRIGNREMFRAAGPLKEPLHIMLLFQSDNPGVTFEYTVPNENATDLRHPEFHWRYMDWSHCTTTCGGGTQRSDVICVEKDAGIVEDFYCNITIKPDDKLRTCNYHLCPARWWIGPWQHCSVTCGVNGINRRTVICVRSLGPDEQIALEDSTCKDEPKPTLVRPCRRKDPCPKLGDWITGEWQGTCNGNPCALLTREIRCEDFVFGCDVKLKPYDAKKCSNISCGAWKVSVWSQCTRSCGGGVQYRNVFCDGGQSCDLTLEPPSERTCNKADCPIRSMVITTTTVSVIPETEKSSVNSTVIKETFSENNNMSEPMTRDRTTSISLADTNTTADRNTIIPLVNATMTADTVTNIPLSAISTTYAINNATSSGDNVSDGATVKASSYIPMADHNVLSDHLNNMTITPSVSDDKHTTTLETSTHHDGNGFSNNSSVFTSQADAHDTDIMRNQSQSSPAISTVSTNDSDHQIQGRVISNLMTSLNEEAVTMVTTISEGLSDSGHVDTSTSSEELLQPVEYTGQEEDNVNNNNNNKQTKAVKQTDVHETMAGDANAEWKSWQKVIDINIEESEHPGENSHANVNMDNKDMNIKLGNSDKQQVLLGNVDTEDLLPHVVEGGYEDTDDDDEEANKDDSEGDDNKLNNIDKAMIKSDENIQSLNVNIGHEAGDVITNIEHVPENHSTKKVSSNFTDVSNKDTQTNDQSTTDQETTRKSTNLSSEQILMLCVNKRGDNSASQSEMSAEEIKQLCMHVREDKSSDEEDSISSSSIASSSSLIASDKRSKVTDDSVTAMNQADTNNGVIHSVHTEPNSLPSSSYQQDKYNIQVKPMKDEHKKLNLPIWRPPSTTERIRLHQTFQPRPTTTPTEAPTTQKLEYYWLPRQWSKCSRHCGHGNRTRELVCIEKTSDVRVANSHCMHIAQLSTLEVCHVQKCLEWLTQGWSMCSTSCGVGKQRRHIHCPQPHQCNPETRPTHIQRCQIKPCIKWVAGQWSMCSRTCGEGKQVRLVQCVNMTTLEPSKQCKSSDKPIERQICNADECPQENFALQMKCFYNKMGYRICEALKSMGQCNRPFVQKNCCRTCGIETFGMKRPHREQKKKKPHRNSKDKKNPIIS